MTLNEVLELGRMGFTKDDILRMTRQSVTKPQPQEQTEMQPQEQTEMQPQEQTIDFLDEIKKLRQEIALNFASVQTEKEESVDDILANILNPKEIK